jgi:hypothetical protein
METATRPVKAYRVLGTSDDVTTCELCGRAELKSTVALQPLDPDGGADGEAVYFGSDCAARAAGWTQKDVRKAAGAADRARAEAERQRRNAIDCHVSNDRAVQQARAAVSTVDMRIPWSERRRSPEYLARDAAETAARAAAELLHPATPALSKTAPR